MGVKLEQQWRPYASRNRPQQQIRTTKLDLSCGRGANWLFAATLGAMLLILAATIILGALTMRRRVREQMLAREAELLHGVAQMQYVETKTSEANDEGRA